MLQRFITSLKNFFYIYKHVNFAITTGHVCVFYFYRMPWDSPTYGMGKGYIGKACATEMYVYVHACWGGGTGKDKAKKEIWDAHQPLWTASHDEDPDLQCSCSPEELIEADSIPVGVGWQWHFSAIRAEKTVVCTQRPSARGGRDPADFQPKFSPFQVSASHSNGHTSSFSCVSY